MKKSFPAWYSFHVGRNERSGALSIIKMMESDIATPVKAANAKFERLRIPNSYAFCTYALIDLRHVESPEHMQQIEQTYKIQWGVMEE